MTAAISFESVSKRFGGGVLAVSDLSFEVQPGRAVGFLGPNGAGKTTTLRILLGLARATSGRALVQGERYAGLAHPTATVGAVLEGSGSHPGRTGRNHLRVLATAAGLPSSRVEEVLELVELGGAANRHVKGYSMGMRQRLALAAALLGDPPILILDEPANGLDPPGMRWLRDMLRSEVSKGRTVLISSHVLAEIAQTVDDVVVIDKGKLIRAGTLEEVTGGDRGVRVRAADHDRLTAELDRRGVTWQAADDGSIAVQGTPPRAVGEAALAAAWRSRSCASPTPRSKRPSSTSSGASNDQPRPRGDPQAAHDPHVPGDGGQRVRPVHGRHDPHARPLGRATRAGRSRTLLSNSGIVALFGLVLGALGHDRRVPPRVGDDDVPRLAAAQAGRGRQGDRHAGLGRAARPPGRGAQHDRRADLVRRLGR